MLLATKHNQNEKGRKKVQFSNPQYCTELLHRKKKKTYTKKQSLLSQHYQTFTVISMRHSKKYISMLELQKLCIKI